LVCVWFPCCEGKEHDENTHLTLESWVAAIHAPAPVSDGHSHSSFLRRSSVLLEEPSSHVSETEDEGKLGEKITEDTSVQDELKQEHHKPTSMANNNTSKNYDIHSENKQGEEKDFEYESTSTSNKEEEAKVNINSNVDSAGNGPKLVRSPAIPLLDHESVLESVSVSTQESKGPPGIKISKSDSVVNEQEQNVTGHHPVKTSNDHEEDQVTSSSSTSVATARMLLVPDGPTAANNLSINSGYHLTWRLTDTNLLEDLAGRIAPTGEGNAPKANPNRSGELQEEKQEAIFHEAASKVVVTRVRPPGQINMPAAKENCQEENSWACLTTKERIQLRQKLLKDLETSYNIPLPSRIRYRLKKKPSIYTSKKPNTRFDIGIPDIYETEVQVTPKYKNKMEAFPTVGYPENDYRVAADISHQQYLPTPARPSYVPIEALITTPKYSESDHNEEVRSYIPLQRNSGSEKSPNLVYHPPRRPPGSTRHRQDGLLKRPTPGRPYFFTPATDRVPIHAHLQYRRPVSFKYKRTSNERNNQDTYEPPTRSYTTESYPIMTPASPYSVKVSMATQHETPPKYTNPPDEYTPKESEYIAPKDPYIEPSEKYIPPTKEYQAPPSDGQTKYTEPPREYIPPIIKNEPYQEKANHPGHKSTPIPYSEPPRNYLPPNQHYSLPGKEHDPSKEHGQPAKVQHYVPPSIPHVESNPPVKGYEEPPLKYLPPNKDYEAPHHISEHTHPVPPINYLPPNKEYSPHTRAPGKGGYRRRRPMKRKRKQKKRPTPPSKIYLPPNKDNEEHVESQGYQTPPGYEETKNSYEPPSKENVVSKPYNDISDSHPVTTIASVMYTTPARTYSPSLESYEAPALIYTTPIPGYVPPSKKAEYKPPHSSFHTPEYVPPRLPTPQAGIYEKPKTSYEVPSQKYELPIKGYIITPPNPEPHNGDIPTWLMHLQGPNPTLLEDKPKAHLLNPTPPPGYHPKHSTREEHFPGTQSPHGYDYHPPVIPLKTSSKHGYPTPVPTYSPTPGYHAPEPTYAPPKKNYNAPELVYIPPRIPHHSTPKPGYHAPEPTYALPTKNYNAPEPAYIPPKIPHHSTLKPGYHAPEPTYAPPKQELHVPIPTHASHKVDYNIPERAYVPPKEDHPPLYYATSKPGYQFPNSTYVTPNPGYAPEPTYAPPRKEHVTPQVNYVPPSYNFHTSPKPSFHAHDTHSLPKAGYYIPQPGYATPKPGYHAPEPTYTPKPEYKLHVTPSPGYHISKPTYVPPKYEGYMPDVTYKPPVLDDTHGPIHHAPSPTYKQPVHTAPIVTTTYSPPRTYGPPESDSVKLPAYVPPTAPHTDKYVPPNYKSTPKTSYIPPPPPPIHIPIDPDYLPLPKKPSSSYLLPQQEYHPPAPYDKSTPKPLDVHLALGAPELPHPTPQHAITPKPGYVPPSIPKGEYVAPEPPKQYIPPQIPPQTHHVTTYKPHLDTKIKDLQDFSYPGTGKVHHVTLAPYIAGNVSATYAPPVYTPSTYGPGYNDLPVTSKPLIQTIPHDDDYYYYYYYYDDDDDDYYYYDDDDYYYYYDDYDYGPLQQKPVPHNLLSNADYDIIDNEIYDFGYIAGIPGRAGRDYPILSYIPLTSFGCDLVADYPGYYADMEAGCQVFHICHRNGRQDSFLCPNGTIFNQKYFVCDWWYNFQCEDAPFFYPVNAAIGQPGVPLHRNAFEPDLRAAQILPPLDPHHQQIIHATPLPAHHTIPAPHNHLRPHVLTIAPHHA
ncbi:hypothetical protein SK128_013562, partial [Halocaridina rubra]